MIRCVWLENNYDISLPSAQFTHCCKMPMMDLTENTTAVNNPHTKRIKKQFRRGIQSPECEFCWREERAGRLSYRQRWLDYTAQFGNRTMIQFQVPSYCQGTCYYCTPHLSTSIANYSTWLNKTATGIIPTQRPNLTSAVSTQHQIRTIEQLPKNKPILIGVVGGEPLIKDTVSDWLPQILQAARNHSDDVQLSVATNGWTQPKYIEQFYRLTKQLNIPAHISISIENTHSRAEWVRGLEWNQFDTTVDLHRSLATTLALKSTENFLSVRDLPNLITWYWQKGFDAWDSGIVNQRVLQTSVLPNSYKKYIRQARKCRTTPNMRKMLERIEATIGTDTENLPSAIRAVQHIDSIRGTDVYAAFPELRRIS